MPAGTPFFHDPRIKCWRALLDLGESRLRASVHFSRASDDPVLQQALSAYSAALDSWLVTLLKTLAFHKVPLPQYSSYTVASVGRCTSGKPCRPIAVPRTFKKLNSSSSVFVRVRSHIFVGFVWVANVATPC